HSAEARPGLAPSSQLRAPSSARQKSGGKEFVLVAIVAVLVLAGGGWFVLKTRAENAEKARLAAELVQKQQAETNRLNGLKNSLRSKLAAARLEWEAYESDLRDAERRAGELKSELRSLRDASPQKKAELSASLSAQELYTGWLKNSLLRHPAKLARVQAEEFLQSGAVDEAAAAVQELRSALDGIAGEISRRKEYFFATTAGVRLSSKPEGVKWILTDAYGRTQEGTTPASVTGLPLTHFAEGGVPVSPFTSVPAGEFTTGKITVRFLRSGWPDVVKEATAPSGENQVIEADFPEGAVAVRSIPTGVPFKITQNGTDRGWSATGTTPATVQGVPAGGDVQVRLSRPGYSDVWQNLAIEPGKVAQTLELDHRSQPVRIKVAEPARILVDGKLAGTQETELSALPPGEHTLQLDAPGYPPYRAKFTVAQKATPALSLAYSFKQLAAENITCPACSGAGSIQHHGRCNQCNGTGRRDCPDCVNGVAGYVDGDYGGGVIGQKMVMCSACNRKGYFICESCTNGTAYWKTTCTTCRGDGKVSKLQLPP
ncbi:MAG TPA: PEGA domain-containing protein, partial [Opitutaceae bacterium]